jgi:phosphatidate cytidylyltransferase
MPAESPGVLKDFAIRTVSALVLGAVILGVLFFGGVWGLAAAVAAVAALCVSELYALARRESRLPNEIFGLIAVIAMPLAAAAYGPSGLTAVVGALIIASLAWHVFFRQVRLTDTAVTVFGAIYVGFTLAHLVLIRLMDNGTLIALTMIISIWVNDVFAYIVGSVVGKHRLAPTISPKKTVEGLIAGSAATIAVWVVIGLAGDLGLTMGWLIVMGVGASVGAVVGDLAESRIKREAAAKDSGRLLPGHGGFLDRFDGFILICIVTYYLLIVAGVQ